MRIYCPLGFWVNRGKPEAESQCFYVREGQVPVIGRTFSEHVHYESRDQVPAAFLKASRDSHHASLAQSEDPSFILISSVDVSNWISA